MQSQEFNKMMSGDLNAKWADMGEVLKVLPHNNAISKQTLINVIKSVEKTIPTPVMEEIQAHIVKLRSDGYKENKIRRIIKNKFHITIV